MVFRESILSPQRDYNHRLQRSAERLNLHLFSVHRDQARPQQGKETWGEFDHLYPKKQSFYFPSSQRKINASNVEIMQNN